MAMASAQLSGVRVVAPTRVEARRSTAGPVQATLRQDVARVAKAAGERTGHSWRSDIALVVALPSPLPRVALVQLRQLLHSLPAFFLPWRPSLTILCYWALSATLTRCPEASLGPLWYIVTCWLDRCVPSGV